ncbi:hypothetical protein RF11_13479 [Thelohanellus kitauei]|uniref:Uncharacterized protein n=1 Tax=Thelohanellus kitauei TaxID=669202 RepID=A0A0C2J7Y4_THEKT|nr:hypothetical protein RF11_13479 [Thelohanellus kitauei]
MQFIYQEEPGMQLLQRLSQTAGTITLHDWVNDLETAEDEITETEMLTNSEIVEQIRLEIEEDREEVETLAIEPSKTHTEAVSYMKWLIKYTESQDYDPLQGSQVWSSSCRRGEDPDMRLHGTLLPSITTHLDAD